MADAGTNSHGDSGESMTVHAPRGWSIRSFGIHGRNLTVAL
jgi:hypothetical protein